MKEFLLSLLKKKVKWSHYRSGVAQRVGTGLALLFHDRGTRGWWVVSGTLRPHFTSGKDPVPIFREAGWAPRSVWTGGKSRPHRDSIPDHPARNQSLYRLSLKCTWHLVRMVNGRVKVQVKQSCYRLGSAKKVPGTHIFISLAHRPPLPLGNAPGTHFC